MKMTTVVIATAITARMPTLSSVHPSERVRGIGKRAFLRYSRTVRGPTLRQEGLQVWVPRTLQIAGRPFEDDAAVLQHDELGLFGLLLVGRLYLHGAVLAVGAVARHEEGIAQLVRDHDRADALDVAQLDDLFVDGRGRDRVQPGGRLVVEQDPRLRRHR